MIDGNYCLWAQSEVLPDGSYGVGIVVAEDRAFALDRNQATQYAVACIARAMEADHNTAVWALLTERLEMPKVWALDFITKQLIPDRPDNNEATRPLSFDVGLGLARYPREDAGKVVPLLVMRVDGEEVGQLSPSDLRSHGTDVLSVIAAADLDASVQRTLVASAGLDDQEARGFVSDLSNYMPEQANARVP